MKTKENLLRELNRSTNHFVEYMKVYAQKETSDSLTENKWHMTQIVEHVVLVDRSVLSILKQPFLKNKNGHYGKYVMRDMLLNRNVKVKNPEIVTPKSNSGKSVKEWLNEFDKQRHDLISQIENEQYDLKSEEAYPHYKLGLLTRYDWVFVVCFHSERHIAQAQELLFCA